jgi:pyruvate/2-oxoglutarate dehydrogenase complex dihydrolipoamide acyltransferase (E2) component
VYTDKLVAKIPSTCTGIVKSVKFAIDDICLVGHSLLEIEVEGSEPATETKKEQPKKEEQVQKQESKAEELVHGPGK